MTDYTDLVKRLRAPAYDWNITDTASEAAAAIEALAAERDVALAANAWQDIATAPKDDVIDTDDGYAIWKEYYAWCLCRKDGYIPSCADWGSEISQISPSYWRPVKP